MMEQDWLDKLSAFRDVLPEGQENPNQQDDTTYLEGSNTARLDIVMEKKGRAGKTATIITGWNGSDTLLEELASTLKKKIGTGGSVRGGEILIQGDRRQDVHNLLKSLGYKCRII